MAHLPLDFSVPAQILCTTVLTKYQMCKKLRALELKL